MKSNRVMLLLATVSGVLAMVLILAFLYTSSQREDPTQRTRPIRIAVADRDLPANHEIGPNDDFIAVEVDMLKFGELARTALKFSELQILEGARLAEPIAAGSPVFYSSLSRVGDLEFPSREMRAISITFTSDNAVGGMLVPGDRIDIYVPKPVPIEPDQQQITQPVGSNPEDAFGAMIASIASGAINRPRVQYEVGDAILSDVEVVAVNRRVSGSRRELMTRSLLDNASNNSGKSLTIIVMLDDEDLKKWLELSAEGDLRPVAALRPPDEMFRGTRSDTE